MRAASGIEPTAFEASVKATTRVRSPISASRASMSSVTSSARMGALRTTRPWSCATSSQGDTLASWSSAVTTISSPGSSVRATACASRKLSVVMLAPNAIPSGSPPVNSAAAARPRSISSSEAAEVGEGPAEVRVRAAQVAVDGVEHLLRRLRPAGTVEVGGARREGREALAEAWTSSTGGTLAWRLRSG